MTRSLDDTLEFRRSFGKQHIPQHYIGVLHPLFTASLLLGACVFCVWQLSNTLWYECLSIPLILLAGNLTVFWVHKYPLHKRLPGLKFAYHVHTLSHHRYFTDKHIHFESSRDFYMVFFPISVVVVFTFIFLPLNYFALSLIFSQNVVHLCVGMSAFYFLLYEVFHFISHLPDQARILKIPYFNYMRNHHRLHHNPRHMGRRNFNLVYPLSDWLFGAMKVADPVSPPWEN